MPRGKRPTGSAFDGKAVPRSKDTRQVASQATPDNEPPSGIGLRPEVLASVPRIAVSREKLLTLPLNHRTGFIVSFVDGSYTIEMILDACAMGRDEAFGILCDLIARGIIVIEPLDPDPPTRPPPSRSG
jgi:hypothetical protein